MIKRLELNESFEEQFERGNLNLLLETEVTAWSDEHPQIKEHIGPFQKITIQADGCKISSV